MEIHFVTGKGGVGKSAVAASLALSIARSGQKTLLVELGDYSYFKDYFALTNVGYSGVPLKDNLHLALWSGAECLKEYAQYLLKFEGLYKLFLENPVSRALIQVAPALNELAATGKITSGPPRNVGPKLNYDCLVIDAYSTGHFMALVKAAFGMSKAIRVGPMAEQSRSIDRVLRNPEICKYYVVSLPEELPVTEAKELSQQLKAFLGIEPTQILNRCLSLPSDILNLQESGEASGFLHYLQKYSNQQQEAQDQLQGQRSLLKLPFVFSNEPWEIVENLSKALA